MVKTNNQKNALAIGEIFNATQPSTQLNLALLDLTLAVPLVDSERVRLLDTLIDGAKHAINKLTDVTDEFKELDFADSLTTRIAQLPSSLPPPWVG